jgi:hypothetical protein
MDERKEMSAEKTEREVVDAIWADQSRLVDSVERAEVVRRGELSALLRLGIRIAA